MIRYFLDAGGGWRYGGAGGGWRCGGKATEDSILKILLNIFKKSECKFENKENTTDKLEECYYENK